MPDLMLWLPLILNVVAWVLFFWFMRNFTGSYFMHQRKTQEEQLRHLEKQTTLLQRIASMLEK